MASQLVLVRIDSLQDDPCHNAACCRLDPCSSQHGACSDESGVLHYCHLSSTAQEVQELAQFRLEFRTQMVEASHRQILRDPWHLFTFVPGMPGELMIVQQHGRRILYATMPRQMGAATDIFEFGSHQAPITSLINNGNIAVSGSSDGCIKIWRMQDGQMTDAKSEPLSTSITALQFLGPLLVAAGNAAGCVTILDISSHRMLAVQRLDCGTGPISCITSFVSQDQMASMTAATFPRGPDGGGLLDDAGILPWRAAGAHASPSRIGAQGKAPLLCVGSESGWLHIYSGRSSGPDAWQLLEAKNTLQPVTAVAFSPWGDTVAVASFAAQLLSTEAVAVAVAGSQPGILGLYELDWGSWSSNAIGTGLAEAAGGQQQQQQSWGSSLLRLYHQWSLKSCPTSVCFMLSSQLELLDGKRIVASQVMDIWVALPGQSSRILHTRRPLQPPVTAANTASSRPGSAQTGNLARAGGTQAASSSTAVELQSTGQGAQASPGRSSDSIPVPTASPSRQWGSLEPDLAERNLSEVAATIAGGLRLSKSPTPAYLQRVVLDNAQPPHPQQQQQCRLPSSSTSCSSCTAEATTHVEQQPVTAAATASAAGDGGRGEEERPCQVHRPSTLPSCRAWAKADDWWTPQAGSGAGLEALAARLQQEEAEFMAQQRARRATPLGTRAPTVSAGRQEQAAQQQEQPKPDSPLDKQHGVSAAAGQQQQWVAEELPQSQKQLQEKSQLTPVVPEAAEEPEMPSSSTFQGAEVPEGVEQASAGPSGFPGLRSSTDGPLNCRTLQGAGLGGGDYMGSAAGGEAPDIGLGDSAASLQGFSGGEPWMPYPIPAEITVAGRAVAGNTAARVSPLPQGQTGSASSEGDDPVPQPRALPAHLKFNMNYSQQGVPASMRAQPKQGMLCPSSQGGTGPAACEPREQRETLPPAAAAAAAGGVASRVRQDDAAGETAAATTSAAEQPLGRHIIDVPLNMPCSTGGIYARGSIDRGAAMNRSGGASVMGRPVGGSGSGTGAPQLAEAQGRRAGTRASWAEVPSPHLQQQSHQWQQQQQQPLSSPQPQQKQPRPLQQQQPAHGSQPQERQRHDVQANLRDQALQRRQDERAEQQQHQQQGLSSRGRLAGRTERVAGAAKTGAVGDNGPAAAAGLLGSSNDVAGEPLPRGELNSTRLLSHRIQALQAPVDLDLDPTDEAVRKLAAKLADLDVPLDQNLYSSLPHVRDITTPLRAAKVVGKQLDAGWVASRNLKPRLDQLWQPEEWQPEFANTQALPLTEQPSLRQLVLDILSLGRLM